jgi:hypothetical protein
MPYFCDKSGARTCAPGISIDAGGAAPAHGDTKRHELAEGAAAMVLAHHGGPPTPQVLTKAAAAASSVLGATAAIDQALARLPTPGREPGRPSGARPEPEERRGGRGASAVERPKKADKAADKDAPVDAAPEQLEQPEQPPAADAPADETDEKPAPTETPAAG